VTEIAKENLAEGKPKVPSEVQKWGFALENTSAHGEDNHMRRGKFSSQVRGKPPEGVSRMWRLRPEVS